MRVFITLILVLLLAISFANGQDAQLSQFYNAPLYLNPAFTGTTLNSRAILNYRNQWPSAAKPFVTYAASFDHYLYNYNSGVGLMFMQNTEGNTKLKSAEISGLYSYHISLNYDWTFIPGLQASFVNRNIDYSKALFPDQFDNSGFTGSTQENLNFNSKSFVDFSTGGLLYSETFWFGASYHHLNRPQQSFLQDNNSRLPGKINFHAGAKIPFASSAKGRSTQFRYKEKAFIPCLHYKAQGRFDQLDIGLNVLYEPILIGVWYRGLPIKRYAPGFTNAESIIGMIGLNKNNLTLGYSYDFVISRLNMKTAGAHELSLIYVFGDIDEKKRKKNKYRPLPCPGFYRNF